MLAITLRSWRQESPRKALRFAAASGIALTLMVVPAAAAELGDILRGRAFAEAVCSDCHGVSPAATISPRSEATPFSVVSRTPGFNEQSLAVFLQTSHASMPNLVITGQNRDDLIAYIVSLRGTR